MQQKTFGPFQKRFKLIFKKALDIFFLRLPRNVTWNLKSHLFNIFPIPILGFHISFRGGQKFNRWSDRPRWASRLSKVLVQFPPVKVFGLLICPLDTQILTVGKKKGFSWWFVDLAYWLGPCDTCVCFLLTKISHQCTNKQKKYIYI